ncbi:MAG: RNA polymerase factor sigma-54 [Betaproteobacteria bacterium]|nr:MAG: RNA polymerase factor sigma-54 [Betaproteobacteria bacterium]
MKQTLQLKLSQQLTLTPQLQQSIRLLQLSTLELNQELEKFLMENPLLERDDAEPESLPPPPNGAAREEYVGPYDETAAGEAPANDSPPGDSADIDWFTDAPSSAPRRDEGEESEYPQLAAGAPTLGEYLLGQLALTQLSARDKSVISTLIAALDENGYLAQSLAEIAELLPPELEVGLDELQIGLHYLHGFDPTGVGARTPAECLELQLKALPADTPARDLAIGIVHSHLDALAAHDFVHLKRQLHCDDDSLRQAQHLIQSLNPHPGAEYAANETRYIVPDVIVKKAKNAWVASLNPDAMPKLRINRMYAEIVQNKLHSAGGQLSGQLQEARWLIKNVQQRFDTILRVAQAIVERQRHFLDHGEVAMRPLVLREIAETLGLHESTVSRVTTQKFMATPRGIFELKYFFGSHVATETGGACSATAIRALLKQLVHAEDRKRPLSDSKIAQILGEQGIVVARRTIAKYRESLHIPPVSLRRSL